MITWCETVVATKPVDKTKRNKSWPRWKCIHEGFGNKSIMQLWVAEQDLKDDFLLLAQEEFGDSLLQIIRIGDYPRVEYTI